MKLLIFYSKTGGGHQRSAESIRDQVLKMGKGWEVVLVDGMDQTILGVRADPAKSFDFLMNSLLPLYNRFYSVTDNKSGVKILRGVIALVFRKSFQQVIKKENPDLILTTHPFISPTTAYHQPSTIPWLSVVSDLGTPHITWADPNLDALVVVDEVMKNYFVKKSQMDERKVIPLGFALGEQFQTPNKSHQITNQILLMGGGAGHGRLKDQAKVLSQSIPDKKVVVVCGRNSQLKEELESLKLPNLEVLGFVDNIHELILKSDILVTKASPNTIMEGAVLNTPLVVTDWIGLQEKGNIDFVLDNKLGIYCPNPKDLPEVIDKIYSSYSDYVQKRKFKNSAKEIAEYIINFRR